MKTTITKETRMKATEKTTGKLSLWDLKEGVTYNAFSDGKKLNRQFKIVDGVLMNNGYMGEFSTICSYVPMDATFEEAHVGERVDIFGIREGFIYKASYDFNGQAIYRKGATLYYMETHEPVETTKQVGLGKAFTAMEEVA